MFEMVSVADPPLLYAIAGVIVLAVASLFGLVLFASREETFEDIVAKQRKAQEALLNSLQQGTTSTKSGKQNRKWNKLKNNKNKKASKGKGPDEHEIDSGVDLDEQSTECVTISAPPPTIAAEEPPPAPAPSKKKKKGKKNKNQQQDGVAEKQVEQVEHVEQIEPIVEVEDVPVMEECVEEEIIEESAAIDVEATPDVPSDDEVDIIADDDDASDEKAEDVAAEDVVPEEEEEEEEVEEVVEDVEPEVVAETEIVEPIVPEPKVEPVVEKSKKKKNKSSNKQKSEVKGAVITNTVDKLQIDIKNCHLNVDEVQQLMDALLEKQSELEQWQKPNQKSDPVEQLKRRIAELEMQFAEERQSAQAIAGKNKELKLELHQERNHRQGIQNEATNRLNQHAKEAEAIRKRMEEKHISEMHSAQSQIKRMQEIIDEGASHHMELQRMKEENAHLKNASMMAQQLAESKQSLMNELSQVQQTNKALRQEFDNLIIHHQQEMQNIQMAKVDSEGALSQRLQKMNDQLMKGEAHNRSLQLEITEHQRMSEQQRLSEMESKQMAAKPDSSKEVDELNSKLAEIQEKLDESELSVKRYKEQAEIQRKELEESCANLAKLEDQLAKAVNLAATVPEDGKEMEPVNDEVANLVASVKEKDQLILVLEQKVSELEQQHSPDLVVVTSGDLLGNSDPLLTSESNVSESFEEVVADKDYEDQKAYHKQETVEEILSAGIVEDKSGPGEQEVERPVVEISLDEDECVPCGFTEGPADKTVEQVVEEIEEEALEASVDENMDKLKADLNTAEKRLAEAQCVLSEKDEAIAGHIAVIAEKDCIIKGHEAAVAAKQAEIDLLQSKILVHETPAEKDGDDEEKDGDAEEKDGDAAEKDGDAAEKDGDAAEKDRDPEEKDGDTEEKDGDAEEKDEDAEEKDGNAEEKLAEAQHLLSEKDKVIAGHIAEIAEKNCIIKDHEAVVATKQAEIELLQSKILAHETPVEKDGDAEEKDEDSEGKDGDSEGKLAEAQHLLSEKDEVIAGHIAEIAEKNCTIKAHEAAFAMKQAEIDLLQSKILAHETSSDSKPPEIGDTEGAIAEYMAKVLELEDSLVAKDTELLKINEKNELSYNELIEKLNTVKEELQGRVEATDELKMKNNELREKHWKVVDALAKAEKLNADHTKSIEIHIMKGLKSIFPDIKIPTNPDNDIDLLFKEFGELVAERTKVKSEEGATKLEEVNKCLQEEIDKLKKTNEVIHANQDEILIKTQQENGHLLEENAHIKNVLVETESMLCRLQTGVDAEVQKWQKKVSEKETELELSRKSNEELKRVLSKHGYEHENLTTLESSLSDSQKQLMAEKEENSRIKMELKETEKNLTDTQKLLAHEKEHANKATQLQENTTVIAQEGEVTELNTE